MKFGIGHFMWHYWGVICLLYIYALYKILEWHSFGVPVCKASMLTKLGGSICLLYICIVLDLQMTLIWCTGMQGIYARWTRGSICLWYLYVYICTGIFLYFLISWLFQIDHIEQQRDHSVLWQFQMGGGHHLSLSHQLTVSNRFSLTVWKCVAVTFSSSSFEWGEDIGQSRFIWLWYWNVH